MLERDVVDELHDDDRLTDSGTAEKSNLAPAQVRLKQVNDFDTGLKHL